MSNENKQAAPRATGSATISFGLLALPIKIYVATSEEKVSFKQISPTSKKPVKQVFIDVDDNKQIERNDCLQGYEHVKEQYVLFTKDEIKSLEEAKSKTIEIVEFLPLQLIDLLYIEKSLYIGPDKGGDKVFALLAQVMADKGVAALGKYAPRGKEQLVLIRPYEGGLLLHNLFYATEIRTNENIGAAKFNFTSNEIGLAAKLVDQLTVDEFAPGKFSDGYVERVRAAVETKLKGGKLEIIATTAPAASILDLEATLKNSLSALPTNKATKAKTKIESKPEPKAAKKKKSA